jgi:tetratricopeptide (TPR) repeat protein
MTNAIAGILYEKFYDLPKRSVAHSIADRIEKEGIPVALDYYKGIKDSNEYYLDEHEMNSTGYEFFQSGKVKEAVAVFKLNTQAFPKSANVYDSYGEALMALGNKTEALENYKKSVKLNPGNVNGLKILKANGIKTDDLVTKVPIEYLRLLQGEYINADDKEWKIKFEITGRRTGLLSVAQAYPRHKVILVFICIFFFASCKDDDAINPSSTQQDFETFLKTHKIL